MNLMPFVCKTEEEGKCIYECDYKYYGRIPKCFKLSIKLNKYYNDATGRSNEEMLEDALKNLSTEEQKILCKRVKINEF